MQREALLLHPPDTQMSSLLYRTKVGRTCAFLGSGEADFINGTTIEIDGGMLPGVLYETGLKTITDMLRPLQRPNERRAPRSGPPGKVARFRHSSSTVAPNDGCTHRYRRYVAAVVDVSQEGLKGRYGLQRFGILDVVLDQDVDEAHAVIEAEDLVGEAFRLVLVQLGEHRLDQLQVFICPIRLGLVPDHNRRHRQLQLIGPAARST
jgi:hypothetical protein